MEMDGFAKREGVVLRFYSCMGDVVSSYPYPVDAPRVVGEFFFSFRGGVCVFRGRELRDGMEVR